AIDAARLERGGHRRLVWVEGELHLRREGFLPPVVRVAHEGGPGARRVALLHEWPGAWPGRLVLAVVEALRHDDHVVVVFGDRVDEAAVRGLEVEGDGSVVDLLHATGVENAAEHRERVGLALRVALGLEAVDDVVHGHRRAVVVLHALADLERPHRGIGVWLPGGRQPRVVTAVLVAEDQELADVAEQFEATLVGDRDRVNRGGRDEDTSPDGAAGLAGWRLASARAAAPARGENAAKQRHR